MMRRYLPVGLAYCVVHDGQASEDTDVCDFAYTDVRLDGMDEERDCDLRQLYRRRG